MFIKHLISLCLKLKNNCGNINYYSTNNSNESTEFIPIIYNNADLDKLKIIKNNKNKSVIYLWTIKNLIIDI
jgi:hypothetical protein